MDNSISMKLSILHSIPTKARVTIAAIIVVLAAGGFIAANTAPAPGQNTPADKATKERVVRTESVTSLSQSDTPLPVVGEVVSSNDVTVRAQTAGEVREVTISEGETVSAGRIIVRLANESEQASLEEARAGVEQAEAALQQTREGARREEIQSAEVSLRQAKQQLRSTKGQSINAVQEAYSTADDAVRSKADRAFTEPRSDDPTLKYSSRQAQLEINIEFERLRLRSVLRQWESGARSLSAEGDVASALKTAEERARRVRDFIGDMASYASNLRSNMNLSESTITSLQQRIQSARTQMNGTISSLSSLSEQLATRKENVESARIQLEQLKSGSRPEEISQAEARVEQARARLEQARQRYEDTIITAPITGTINSLDVEAGDYVSVGGAVAELARNDNLAIETFISPEERSYIKRGAAVTLAERNIQGVVSEIASTVKTQSQKIKVTVSITSGAARLQKGEHVSLNIERMIPAFPPEGERMQFAVPLTAVQIGSDGPRVFTVNEDNIVQARRVQTGAVLGDAIVITGGVAPETHIIVEAQGVEPGDRVRVTDE